MLSTLAKKSTEPAVSEFEAAEARWKECRDKDRDLIEREEGLKLALTSSSSSGIDNRTPQHLRDRAEQIVQGVRRPQELNSLLEHVHDEIADFKPKLGAENEAWQGAQQRETNRFGALLQPRHREAVVSIGAALEALSQAILSERQVRAELVRLAPLPTSANLPDLSSTLQVGCLGDWDSPAWNWRRRCHQIGVFK